MPNPRAADQLDDWILATAPRAVAYARSLLNHPDDAEDIVQDCYCRLIAKAQHYDLPRDGLKLLLRSITNACINLKTRRRAMISLNRAGLTANEESPIDPADPSSVAPDDVAVGRELESAMGQALELLPPQQRAAVELKSLGHSQQEIAEILGTTSTNAGVLIHRARHALARVLAPFLGGETVS